MYVLDAVGKSPYEPWNGRPYAGSRNPEVPPGPGGHFDHLDLDGRAFSCAAMYATVRRVLDIWEDYFGRRIEWHFRLAFERLELIPLVEWDNAHSGFGFLEFGFGRSEWDDIDFARPYCQNFDVLAHELGHSLVFAEVGIPAAGTETDEYGGFHESAADLVALVSSLHFETMAGRLLERTKGNLFSVNELSRVGELSASRQIRIAFNYERMSTVGREAHDLSRPLTGAIFDVLVELYEKELVRRNLISQDLATRSYHAPGNGSEGGGVAAAFAEVYEGRAEGFRAALLAARDAWGTLLASLWASLSPHHFAYYDVGAGMLDADRRLSSGANEKTIRDCFAWREISVPEASPALRPHSLAECGLLRAPSVLSPNAPPARRRRARRGR